MKSNTLKIGLFTLALCSWSVINAQDSKKMSPEKIFEKTDADANGSISLEEFKKRRMRDASKEKQIEKRFAKMDTDGNGSLDMAEFEEALKQMKSKRGNKKAKMDDNND